MNTPFKTVLVLLISAGAIVTHADIVVVVSAKSSLTSLTKQQVSDLFLGKSNAFPDGGQSVPIEQSEGTVDRNDFHGRVTGKSATQLKAYWSKQIFSGTGVPPKEAADAANLKKMIAANPNVIGYLDKKDVDPSVKVVQAP